MFRIVCFSKEGKKEFSSTADLIRFAKEAKGCVIPDLKTAFAVLFLAGFDSFKIFNI